MMKRMTVAAWMAMGLLTLPFAVQAEQASPAVLADAGAACHGTDGKSPSNPLDSGQVRRLYGATAHGI